MFVLAFLMAALPLVAQAQPAETEVAGVTAEVLELRQSGGLLRLAIRFANSGAATADFSRYWVGRIVLVDAKSKKKHLPLKDANGHFIAGPIGDSIDGGRIALKVPARQSTVLWAYFEPVAPGTVMTVEVPQVFPFDNVPVTEGAGKVFASATAATTPGGAVATLVSAKRADQVVNVRLRFSAERGQSVNLLSPYFMFWNVFLLDPVSKRKYPLVKDAEGIFQGQPLRVTMEGGGFIPDWGKTTLVSFTFQAPPDTVQRADLLMPQFLPFEGVTIEGLGGAAAGGIAAAGTTLGLEGALKELKAEVTAAEIKNRSRRRRALRLRQGQPQEGSGAEPAEPRHGAQSESWRGGDHRRPHRRQGRRCLQPDPLRTTRRVGEAVAGGECASQRRDDRDARLGEVKARHPQHQA